MVKNLCYAAVAQAGKSTGTRKHWLLLWSCGKVFNVSHMRDALHSRQTALKEMVRAR